MHEFFPLSLKAGKFFVFSALITCATGFFLSVVATKREWKHKKQFPEHQVLSAIEKLILIPLALSVGTLVISLVRGDYFIKFVAEHSNSMLPLIYKITALWGGQEGSVLFWTMLLATQVALSGRKPAISHAISFGTILFFLVLCAFVVPPFSFIYPPPPDGRELNPLLQHFGMILHPVFLYLGLTGLTIPFSLHIGYAFLTYTGDKKGAEEVRRKVRRWALITWSWLTLGIIVGGWWAYSELGWGGYWAWDPVENASFIPWLTLTAFLHTSMIEKNLKALKVLNSILIFTSFILGITGTFLVRTGMFISVHSFVQNPELGVAFLSFISIMIGLYTSFIFLTWEKLKGEKLMVGGLLSREFFLLICVVILIAMWATVMVGTIFPVIYESITGDKISFGKPFFESAFGPLSAILLLAMSVGQILPWGGKGKVIGKLIPSFIVGVAVFLLCTVAELYLKTGYFGWQVGLGLGLGCAGITAVLTQWWEKKFRKDVVLPLLSHFGFFVMSLGIALSTFAKKEGEFAVLPEEEFTFDGYVIRFDGLEMVSGKNWSGVRANFTVKQNGDEFSIHSEKRKYATWDEMTTEAGIKWGVLKDFYIVFVKIEEGKVYVKVWENPLVSFIWMGTTIMFAGGMLSALLRKRA